MRKVRSIQYLRALAVILVILFHAAIRLSGEFSADISQFLRFGGSGVDLFFVISGFIMWTIADGRPTAPGPFMMRRITRIVPIYWIATLAWCGFAFVALSWLELTPEHILKSLFFVPHFSASLPEDIFPVLVPGWTLTYEMFFYVIFALCLTLPSSRRLIALCASLVALVVLGAIVEPTSAIGITYTNPLLLEFLAGVLIGYLWKRDRGPRGALALGCVALGVGGLVHSGLAGTGEGAARVLYWGVPATLIVLGTLGVRAFERSNAPLALVGDASYSIYLTHIFVLTCLDALWNRIPLLPGSRVEAPVFFAISIALSLAVGIACYRSIEQPLEVFFRTKVFGRRATAAQ
jgi:exopolysaccharide production protein ExoZ